MLHQQVQQHFLNKHFWREENGVLVRKTTVEDTALRGVNDLRTGRYSPNVRT